MEAETAGESVSEALTDAVVDKEGSLVDRSVAVAG